MINVMEVFPNGRLGLSLGFPNESALALNMTGKNYIMGDYDQGRYYILNGQPTERPASPVTLSDLTLLAVPAGSTLTINGEKYENVEGDIELEFPLPGTYRLRVECWPYRDWEGEVTAP